MLSVAEALATVLQHTQRLPPAGVPLTPAVLGAVLAEDVASDLDMPPLRQVDDGRLRGALPPICRRAQATLHVIEEVTAGRMPRVPLTRARRRGS